MAIRTSIVMTHPVQYFAPWFRTISRECPELDLTVLYATQPSAQQQGVGFGAAFQWDIPLLEGYNYRIVRPASAADNVHSGQFMGLNVPEMNDALRAANPQVVLVPGWFSVTLVRSLFWARRNKIPALYRGDTNLNNQPGGWRKSLWRLKTRQFLRFYKGYLCVGKRANEYLHSFGIPDSRIFRSPHCVDNDFFARRSAEFQKQDNRLAARTTWGLLPQEFVLLYCGKMEMKKRPLDAIRALQGLQNVALLMVGAGPMEGECRTLAQQLHVKVVFAGFLNQSEIGKAYAVADALVLPSDGGETWGLVVNEAMATGLPSIVSSLVGAAPDLVENNLTGELFEFSNVEKMKSAIRRVQSNIQNGQDYRSACLKRIENYSLKKAADGLVAAAQSLK